MKSCRVKEIRKMVANASLELVSLQETGSNHYKARVRAAPGMESNFIFSATPSDVRGDKNKLSLLRRFARGDLQIARMATA